MQQETFNEAFRQLVLRALDTQDHVDRRALYPARVVRWLDGGGPSGTVDVFFEDARLWADGRTRFGSKTGVPWVPPIPGQSCQPAAGTLCLVGWVGGDEREPYATGWQGLGGVSLYRVASPATVFAAGDTGYVAVEGDLRSQHEVGISAGALSATVTPTATLSSIAGDDTAFTLTVSCADNTKIFSAAQVTLGRAFAAAPRCVVSATDSTGSWSTGIPSAKGTSTSTIEVKWNGSPLIGPGTFAFTVFVRG